jgi:hypothetical protein
MPAFLLPATCRTPGLVREFIAEALGDISEGKE